MVSFWHSINNEFNKVGNFFGGILHQGFTDFNNLSNTAAQTIQNVANRGFTTVDNTVKGAVDLGKNTEKTIGGAVSGFENILSIPLILIAGGLAFFLLSPNAGKAIDVGGEIAMKKL
jgi:hypothetical protein